MGPVQVDKSKECLPTATRPVPTSRRVPPCLGAPEPRTPFAGDPSGQGWRAGPGAARTQRCSRCPPPRAERGGAAGLHLPCCTGGGRPSRADAAGGSRRRLCPCGAGGAAPAQVGAAGGGPAARGWALLARGVPAEGTRPRRPLPCSPLRRPPPSPAGPPRTPLRARLPPALRPFPGSPRGPRATRTRCSVSQPPGPPWIRPWRPRRWEGLGWGRAGCSDPRDTPHIFVLPLWGTGARFGYSGASKTPLFTALSHHYPEPAGLVGDAL